MGRKSKAKFELKGHTLPGINQKSEASNLKDGKSPSSAFQMQSPMKETTMPGVKIDPTLSYKYKSAKIPSFRDIISLEQQQDYAKRVDERRAKRKEDRERKSEDTGLDKKEIRLDSGLDEESMVNKPIDKFNPDPLAEEKIKYGNINTQHLNVDMPIGEYAKRDPNKTYSTLGGSASNKSKKTNIQGSLL